MDWYSIDKEARVLAAWPDAPIENQEVLGMLLDVARDQVLAYAPALPVAVVESDGTVAPVPIPSRYVLAQLQQAQNLWNAGRVSSAGDVGDDAFTFTPRPMDKTIRQIIRPVDGRPHAL